VYVLGTHILQMWRRKGFVAIWFPIHISDLTLCRTCADAKCFEDECCGVARKRGPQLFQT